MRLALLHSLFGSWRHTDREPRPSATPSEANVDTAVVVLQHDELEINMNLDQHRGLVSELTELGFQYSDEQVMRARRVEGQFAGCGNFVFRR